MAVEHGWLVHVQSDWKEWRQAHVHVADVYDLHWRQPIGAPHPLLHGWIDCASIATGDLPHQCDAATAPHRLRICILKCHTAPTVYAELARRADGPLAGDAADPAHSGLVRAAGRV